MVIILSGTSTILNMSCAGGSNPPYAISAHFSRIEKLVPCLYGTRVEVLDELYRWIACDIRDAHEHTPPIFWINGSAGSGKSTIAFTCAKHCEGRGILAANFFCSRDNADCSNVKLVFTTIAYQMGQFCPEFKSCLSNVLKGNPDVVHSNISNQLEKMIVEPLFAVRDKFPPSVVIIDALDECKGSHAASTILASLFDYIDQLFPLQFLITSRPLLRITGAFQGKNMMRVLTLHEVKSDIISS